MNSAIGDGADRLLDVPTVTRVAPSEAGLGLVEIEQESVTVERRVATAGATLVVTCEVALGDHRSAICPGSALSITAYRAS